MKKQFTLTKRTTLVITVVIIAVVVFVTTLYLVLRNQTPPIQGNVYLTPASLSFKKDAEVQLNVRMTPGTPIDTVTATLGYDPSLLAYKTVTYNNSPFDSQIPATNTNQKITLQVAKLGGEAVSDDAFVGTVIFTALRDGSTRPTLSAGNAARAGKAVNPNLARKTVSSAATNKQSTAATSSSAVAQIAPWLMIAIGVLLLAGVAIAVVKNRKQKKAKHKEPENELEKAKETDTQL